MRRERLAWGLLLAAWLWTSPANADQGFVIELDRARYSGRVVDLESAATGPSFPVAFGSPANPTPEGDHAIAWVILRPSWQPGPRARAAGAVREPSSLTTPMGVAKIPFARAGAIALHGGGDARLLGQPVSGGCVRARDADLLRLLGFIDLQGGLGPPESRAGGEIHRPLVRPARVVVR